MMKRLMKTMKKITQEDFEAGAKAIKNMVQEELRIEKEVNARLSQKLRIIDPYEVVKIVHGKVTLGGELLTDQELANLKSEVQILRSLKLWRIFQLP